MKRKTGNDKDFEGSRDSRGRVREGALFPASRMAKVPDQYLSTLEELKNRIKTERLMAVMRANSALVILYYDIGSIILKRQASEGWGARIIDRLSADLKRSFPDMRGFSPRNLKYMRAFAAAWPQRSIVQETLAQLTWYHNIALLERLADKHTRLWYANKVMAYGWSHAVLSLQIESRAHERHGKAAHNFHKTLPPPDSDMAVQAFKDPYLFDFLGTDDPRREREIELALVDHIQQFLLEMGAGFAFVGRQVHLEVGNDDFYIDLLFYHLTLRCYVVVELKAVPFDSSFIGKMNFYLSAVDDLLKHPDDKPSIGLLLCKSKNRILAEYALRGIDRPIGIANWEAQIVKTLPKELKGSLPTIEELESELTNNGKTVLSGKTRPATSTNSRKPKR